jgi:hypothetical protein
VYALVSFMGLKHLLAVSEQYEVQSGSSDAIFLLGLLTACWHVEAPLLCA